MLACRAACSYIRRNRAGCLNSGLARNFCEQGLSPERLTGSLKACLVERLDGKSNRY